MCACVFVGQTQVSRSLRLSGKAGTHTHTNTSDNKHEVKFISSFAKDSYTKSDFTPQIVTSPTFKADFMYWKSTSLSQTLISDPRTRYMSPYSLDEVSG